MRTQKVEMAYAQAARLRNLADVLAKDAMTLPTEDPLRAAALVRCETYRVEAIQWEDSIKEEIVIPEQLQHSLSSTLRDELKYRMPS